MPTATVETTEYSEPAEVAELTYLAHHEDTGRDLIEGERGRKSPETSEAQTEAEIAPPGLSTRRIWKSCLPFTEAPD